jgi:hypothetical protein
MTLPSWGRRYAPRTGRVPVPCQQIPLVGAMRYPSPHGSADSLAVQRPQVGAESEAPPNEVECGYHVGTKHRKTVRW